MKNNWNGINYQKLGKSYLLLLWPLEKWPVFGNNRGGTQITRFLGFLKQSRKSFMSLDIIVGLSCKWESKLLVTESFPTGQEKRGRLLSKEIRVFKEIMKNGHQSERTSGLAPLEQHCQCFLIVLCQKYIIHDSLTPNIGLIIQPGRPINYFWK